MPPKEKTTSRGGEGAPERGGDARRIVAEVLGPVELDAARPEDLDRPGEVLVLPLARQDFVADDQDADRHRRQPAAAGLTISRRD